MAARGDVSREEKNLTAPYAATIAGALGMGNDDFSRENPPKAGGGGTGPTLPTFGQIFPSGR